MKPLSKALAKKSVAAVAAGAMAMTSAAPAFARDRHKDGPSAGEIIAGAVVIGGLAALLSSGKKDRYRHRDYDYRHDYRPRRGNGERAVRKCIRAAERDARRYGFRFADVTEIRDVDRRDYGWRVKGRIVVDGQRGYRGRGYDRGYNNRGYYRGDRHYNNGYGYNADRGKFTCHIERGRVVDVNYRGIRGL